MDLCAQFSRVPFPSSGNECDLIMDASKQKINFRERQATNGGYDRRGISCDLVEFAPQWVLDAVGGLFDSFSCNFMCYHVRPFNFK